MQEDDVLYYRRPHHSRDWTDPVVFVPAWGVFLTMLFPGSLMIYDIIDPDFSNDLLFTLSALYLIGLEFYAGYSIVYWKYERCDWVMNSNLHMIVNGVLVDVFLSVFEIICLILLYGSSLVTVLNITFKLILMFMYQVCTQSGSDSSIILWQTLHSIQRIICVCYIIYGSIANSVFL
jgi:hypothetical protein